MGTSVFVWFEGRYSEPHKRLSGALPEMAWSRLRFSIGRVGTRERDERQHDEGWALSLI
jgi:hypothetical protein